MGRRMNSMRAFFLRAAHCQIFLLMTGLYVADMLITVSLIGLGPVPVKNIPLSTVLLLQAAVMFVFAVFFLWLWSMGSFLNFLVKAPLRSNFGFFRFALIFPVVSGLAFSFVETVSQASRSFVVLPIHMLAMGCIIYAFRFVAKSLALLEETRYLTFRDYYRTFFLLWFFPIGVWFVQPK